MAERTERDHVLVGAVIIEYEVRRSRRRRKTVEITLGADGIRVAAPLRTPGSEVQAFVQRRAAWILRHAPEAMRPAAPPRLASGATLPYLGREVSLAVEPAAVDEPQIQFDPWRLRIAVPAGIEAEPASDALRRALTAWYRARADTILHACVDRWWPHLGLHERPRPRLLIRAQRQRWGSCARDGTIRVNWRIVMAAPALIDYVVVHELAHLHAMNHSPAYWSTVAALVPDYRERRARLREIGPSLRI